jgi:hypothetical protein
VARGGDTGTPARGIVLAKPAISVMRAMALRASRP